MQLPVALAWELNYTVGSPCDSLLWRVPWQGDLPCPLAEWSLFQAEHQGEVVFTGVIDEVEASYAGSGGILEISGRGMAARLLDNEVLGQEYMTATLDDVIGTYVTPFGVSVGARESMPSRSSYVVETGSSAWAVLEDFVCYYGDVVPRFNGLGELYLTALPEDEIWDLGSGVPVTELRQCWKRYGACSEVWVRDRVTREVNKAVDAQQVALGLCARAVVTTSSQSSQQKRSYDGNYRLENSQEGMFRGTVTLPWLQFLAPGTLVSLDRENCPWNGVYRLLAVDVVHGSSGEYTTLTLGQR